MKNYLIVTLAVILLSSCAEIITRGKQYAKLYEEKPASIVIMPPINQTNSVEAKDLFYITMYMPLCEKGYYVYSPYLTMEMFQTESAYDSEMFLENDINIFKKVLGADAAMFTIIKCWNRKLITGELTVGVEYILRSTSTGETLYHREGLINIDTSMNTEDEGLLETIVGMAFTALNTAMTDKIVAGRKCNAFVLSDMPVGKYHPNYGKDQNLEAGKSYIKVTVK